MTNLKNRGKEASDDDLFGTEKVQLKLKEAVTDLSYFLSRGYGEKENDLNSRYRSIEYAEPTQLLYPKIRELVTKFNNQSALVTLSKYKNSNDLELILKNRDSEADEESGYFYTYKAIQNFNHSRFLPFLEERLFETLDNNHYSNEWAELYSAIATYKNQKSVELLRIPFTKVQNPDIKRYHIDFVYDAILANQVELYDELLWKIWSDEHQITLEGFKYLLPLDNRKALELSKKQLHPNYQIKNIDKISNTDPKMFTENLEETMFNFIFLNDRTLAYDIMTDKIGNADVHDFGIYSGKVSELKDDVFIEPLFKRLQIENNPYVYLQIVETLISFKSDSINKRILETRKENKNMNENWGSNSLDQILEKNNIK